MTCDNCHGNGPYKKVSAAINLANSISEACIIWICEDCGRWHFFSVAIPPKFHVFRAPSKHDEQYMLPG
jgi:RNase P subunit RPR2